MQKEFKSQKGITLVALVITIIVMLILVAVSVTVAINGGLFTKAKEAGNSWEDKSAQEAAGNIVNVDNQIMNIDSAINTLQERPKTETPVNPEEPQAPAQTITFTVDDAVNFTEDKNYEATEGWTWAQWIESNPDAGLIVDESEYGYVRSSNGDLLIKGGIPIRGEDPIENGQTYTISQM